MNKVENQVSTGLGDFRSAADNASYWSIATKMTSNVGALGAVSSALSESQSMVSTMSTALHGLDFGDGCDQERSRHGVSAGADLKAIQTDITAQQASLISIGSRRLSTA